MKPRRHHYPFRFHFRTGALVLLGAALVGLGITAALPLGGEAQTLKGLQISASQVTRAKRVSLQDCPPGENSVRGVIRPNEENEFLTVSITVEVLPSFSPVDIEKPLLYDDAGNEYKTAQSFRDVNAEKSYTCQFSFRVPQGTTPSRFGIEDVSFDLSSLAP